MKRAMTAMCLAALMAGGCTSYYKVIDPSTNKTYYTTELRRKDNGATTLKDARTGNMVTIQNSEVEPINKEEFESGKAQPEQLPAQKPAEPSPFK